MTNEQPTTTEELFHISRRRTEPNSPEKIITNVELMGRPVPIHTDVLANSGKGSNLPSMRKLLDPHFYERVYYDNLLAEAMGARDSDFRASEYVRSPVDIRAEKSGISCVHYTQAFQFFNETSQAGVRVNGRPAFEYDKDRGLNLPCRVSSDLEALAEVAVFSAPVALNKYFSTPKDTRNWNDGFFIEGVAKRVFDENFRELVTAKAREISDKVGKPVKGILLSPARAEYNPGFDGVGAEPKGRIILAASYLV